MGTNFYVNRHRGDDDPKYHIGKRSAAGLYCWDCGVTLCKQGNEGIHESRSGWHEQCPICGKLPIKEGWDESSAGRELGFNKNPPKQKNGVASCSSFTWARELGKVQRIVDEYGREFTRDAFLEMLKECPVQFKLCGSFFS
jgi:hypothetical protein